MQTKVENEFRWYHGDVFSISDFEEQFNNDLGFFKVDMVIRVKDILLEHLGRIG